MWKWNHFVSKLDFILTDSEIYPHHMDIINFENFNSSH